MTKPIKCAIAAFAIVAGIASVLTMAYFEFGIFNYEDWAISGTEISYKYHLFDDYFEVDVPKHGTFDVPMGKTKFMPSDEYRVTLFWCEFDTSFFTKHRREPKRLLITFASIAELKNDINR